MTVGRAIDIVRKGESLDFTFDRDGKTIVDWICTINVRKYPGDASLITRVIPPDNNSRDNPQFKGFLTSTETDGLATGTYRLVGILTNASTDEEEQQNIRFNVTEKWST